MPIPPRRIVSLVPSLSETVCCLGAGGRLVGVTRYCVEPEAELRSVARVGGTKNPALERIADLEPDLVLANEEENRPEHIDWLQDRFEVLVSTPRTVPEAADAVRQLGRRLMRAEEMQAVLLSIEAQMTRAQVEGMTLGSVKVFYAIWNQPWMSVNRDTYVHDVLERAGAVSVCADRPERYPVVQEAELAHLDADLILLPSEPYAFTDEDRTAVLRNKTFGSGVPVMLVDGRAYCWHGARTGVGLGQAVDLLKRFRRR